jgi:putative FmdB family regulatory protein
MLVFDYICKSCERTFERIVKKEDKDNQQCPICNVKLERLFGCSNVPITTIPVYPGSHARMAGYCHQYVNQPREKVGVSVSCDLKK